MNNNIIFLDVDEVAKTTEKLEVIVKDEKLSADNINLIIYVFIKISAFKTLF